MRILIVTRNLPPLVGGMERLNWHMIDQLSHYAEVAVVCPDEAVSYLPKQIQQYKTSPLKPLARFLSSSLIQTIKLAREFKPDIVLAGSGLMAPHASIINKLCGAKSLAYLHGLDITAEHLVYKYGWRPAIRSLNRVIVNSTSTAELLDSLRVETQKIGIVNPGVSMPQPRSTEQVESFKRQHNLLGYKLLLSAGRLTHRKGLKEFVCNALPLIVKEQPDSLLLILGDAPTNSLLAKYQTPDEIMAEAKRLGLSQHIRFFGAITDSELSLAYYASAVHIFPVITLKNDPEGFGMVAIEAAAHGLPTVAFATGGIVDAVRNNTSGYLISPGNYLDFALQTATLLKSTTLEKDKIIDFSRAFEWDIFGKKIVNQICMIS